MTDNLAGGAALTRPAETKLQAPGWLGQLAALLAFVALALAVWSAVLGVENRALGKTVGEQQNMVARARSIAQVDNALIQLISRTAAQTDDAELAALLTKNGVSFQEQSRPTAGPPQISSPGGAQ